MRITRYAYRTASTAGAPERVELDPRDIDHVLAWRNHYGNPSYVYVMVHADTAPLYLVDDYGALDDLPSLPVYECRTRREMLHPFTVHAWRLEQRGAVAS